MENNINMEKIRILCNERKKLISQSKIIKFIVTLLITAILTFVLLGGIEAIRCFGGYLLTTLFVVLTAPIIMVLLCLPTINNINVNYKNTQIAQEIYEDISILAYKTESKYPMVITYNLKHINNNRVKIVFYLTFWNDNEELIIRQKILQRLCSIKSAISEEFNMIIDFEVN